MPQGQKEATGIFWTPGELCKLGTGSQWRIVELRRAPREGIAEVRALDGVVESADEHQLTPLRVYLELEHSARVFSLTREGLCRRFYGRDFDRLPDARLREMQRILKRSGVRYEPEEWSSGDRIQLRPEGAGPISSTGNRATKAIEAALPGWVGRERLPEGSRDPLGFQGIAESLANELLPGLTVSTRRIGYYGLVAWALDEANCATGLSRAEREERIHRLERAVILCEFILHGAGGKTECRVLGERSRMEVLGSGQGDRFRVPARILNDQSGSGAFRLYLGSLISLGFVQEADALVLEDKVPYALTESGEALAREFGRRVPEGFLAFAISERAVERERLRGWGEELCLSRNPGRYRRVIREGLLRADSGEAEARWNTADLLFRLRLLDQAQLSNGDVLTNFLCVEPNDKNEHLQLAGLFQIASLGLTAVFAHALGQARADGAVPFSDLRAQILAEHGNLCWTRPVRDLTGVRPLEALLGEFAAEEAEDDETGGAAAPLALVGGLLLKRLLVHDVYLKRKDELASRTNFGPILDQIAAAPSFAESYEPLLLALVERHQAVSEGKQRQRWCRQESGELICESQSGSVAPGWHAFRFPQLNALRLELELTREELRDAA